MPQRPAGPAFIHGETTAPPGARREGITMRVLWTRAQVRRGVASAGLVALVGLGSLPAAFAPQPVFAAKEDQSDQVDCDEVGRQNDICDDDARPTQVVLGVSTSAAASAAPDAPILAPVALGVDVTDPRHGDDVKCDEVGHDNRYCEHGIAKHFLANPS